jgi:nitrogen fixation NifU-like protein
MEYSKTVRDHFHNPRHAGAFPDGASGVVSAQVGEALRGGVIRLQLKIEQERVIDVRQQVYGSAYLIAAASWLADWLQGKQLSETQGFDKYLLEDALQLPSSKAQCAVLAETALYTVLSEFNSEFNSMK